MCQEPRRTYRTIAHWMCIIFSPRAVAYSFTCAATIQYARFIFMTLPRRGIRSAVEQKLVTISRAPRRRRDQSIVVRYTPSKNIVLYISSSYKGKTYTHTVVLINMESIVSRYYFYLFYTYIVKGTELRYVCCIYTFAKERRR